MAYLDSHLYCIRLRKRMIQSNQCHHSAVHPLTWCESWFLSRKIWSKSSKFPKGSMYMRLKSTDFLKVILDY